MKIYSINGQRVDGPQKPTQTPMGSRKVEDNRIPKTICDIVAILSAMTILGVFAYLLSLIHWLVAVVAVSVLVFIISCKLSDEFQ